MSSQTKTHRRATQVDYQQFAKRRRPKPAYLRNALWAFVVGGIIALVGQLFTSWFVGAGLPPDQASGRAAVALAFIGALLTGLGVYDQIARFGGAGAAIPVTGFANSIVAPAMEFAREGYVFGMAARMFQVAGPVIVFGVSSSVVVGIIRWLVTKG
ncbi:MAG: stage V sporulation protein AC [Limnochordaceae bacterium]|nr:stage V sporulation protein AC [Limnochordaceae bacterium]